MQKQNAQARMQRTLAALEKEKGKHAANEKMQQERGEREYETLLESEKRNAMCEDCEICCEPRAPHRFVECDNRLDRHSYCEVCVRRHLREQIFEKASPWMRCLGDGCVAFYKRVDYERILGQDAIDMRDRLELRTELRNVEGMTACLSCDFAMFIDDGVEVFDCRNPSCMKSFCLKCKEEPHFGRTCGEAQDAKKDAAARGELGHGGARDDLRRKVEEYISEALIRKCSDCGMSFVKESGCNQMRCICGRNVSCYACGAEHVQHDHWMQGTCRLFESTEEREATERREAEKQAIAKVMQENPGVREEDLKVREFSENVKKDDEMRRAKERFFLVGEDWHPGMEVHGADSDTMADITAQMSAFNLGGARGIVAAGASRQRRRRAGGPARQKGQTSSAGAGLVDGVSPGFAPSAARNRSIHPQLSNQLRHLTTEPGLVTVIPRHVAGAIASGRSRQPQSTRRAQHLSIDSGVELNDPRPSRTPRLQANAQIVQRRLERTRLQLDIRMQRANAALHRERTPQARFANQSGLRNDGIDAWGAPGLNRVHRHRPRGPGLI
ncbi:uncharacterized protein PV09_02333 [Verruconis gallopava]|uniref:RING-type domain-containing protein n=1 Tax=Verruconis gallopava TaxID=253628 RepID=A0A0D2AJ91_9PEZI|nr:uncharacterized protein PV09_02333 [Verruconis gallopava]KIW06620.1 hypothetical protein PV09_02333 [Verruconis gallopava]